MRIKILLLHIFMLVFGSAYAQSKLPVCEGAVSMWSNCFGTKKNVLGNTYIGEFLNGKNHGQGTALMLSGNKYIGEFKNDEYHGRGTFIFGADNQWKGGQHVGDWVANKRTGLGIYYASNGAILLSGIWKDDVLVSPSALDTNKFPLIRQSSELTDPVKAEPNSLSGSLAVAQLKCEELGFKPKTEGFGKCVLQLSK